MSRANPLPPSLYCNLAKLHPLGVYIGHERSSHVLSFVSLYFAVVYSARACFTNQYSCNSVSFHGELYIYCHNRFKLIVVCTIPELNLCIT